MATVAEIKEGKREYLDQLAAEQGIDPAQYSKKEDLQAELLKSADDATDEGDDEGDDEDSKEQNTTTNTVNQVANDADRAADEAEKVTERKPVSSTGHAATFDKNGQPVFGKGRA